MRDRRFTSGWWVRVLGCAGAVFALACDRGPAQPDIVLVTIDTLRADRLSSYGYARETSPFIDSLAARGVRFERAYSTTSWTAPAVVSMLSSLPPRVHGVEHGYLTEGEIVKQEVIPTEAALLPELLQQAGYRTFGITGNGHLDSALGFARGFDRYTCLGFADAEEIEQKVAEWRDALAGETPYFLWLHFFDPHAPYRYHAPFTKEFAARRRELRKLESEPVAEFLKRRGVRRGNDRLRYVEALYDGEIRRTDAVLERIFTRLGVSQDALVVVTSDHGEEFLEHGRLGHGNTLYEEVTRVPLIVSLPGHRRAGAVIDEPVSLLDLAPSVLAEVSVAAPAELQGRPLFERETAEGAPPREIVTALSRILPLETRSLTQGRWKYIHRFAAPEIRALYDLQNDPREESDLAAREPDRVRRMAARLGAVLDEQESQRLEPGEEPLTDEGLEALKALGYVE